MSKQLIAVIELLKDINTSDYKTQLIVKTCIAELKQLHAELNQDEVKKSYYAIELDKALKTGWHSRYTLADEIEVSQATLSRYLNGKTVPTGKIKERIDKFLKEFNA